MATKRPGYKKTVAIINKPSDWLFGSNKVGSKYTAWNTYGQGKPDMGKGVGPGEPFHKIQKTVLRSGGPDWKPSRPSGPEVVGRSTTSAKNDPRTEAIRRRLRGL